MWTLLVRAFGGVGFVGTTGGVVVDVVLGEPAPWRSVLLTLGIIWFLGVLWNDPWTISKWNELLGPRKRLVEAISYLLSIIPILILLSYVIGGSEMVDSTTKRLFWSSGIMFIIASVLFVAGFSRLPTKVPTQEDSSPAGPSSVESKNSVEKLFMAEQSSKGDGSPNILGDNNEVTINISKSNEEGHVENASWTMNPVKSPIGDLPYAYEITVHVNTSISPFGFGVLFDKPIDKAESFVIGAMMDQIREFSSKEFPDRSYIAVYDSPAITPRNPVLIQIYAKHPISVERFERILQIP